MASVTEICNIALSNIRAGSINSLDENSLSAQVCKLKYGILRDRCLKETAWQFNRVMRPLSLLTTDLFNWAYAYAYPSDCLKIQRLMPDYEKISTGNESAFNQRYYLDETYRDLSRRQIPYEIFNVNGTKTIGSNQPDVTIDFSARVTDPNLFSDDFILSLSYLLSSEIAIPIVGTEMGRALKVDALQMYRQYMASAIADDQNERYTAPNESDFINVRM